MAPQEVEGETLGQKHQRYNGALQELITSQTSPDSKFDDNDINNFLKIDVASHNRDVSYILDVLKSEDMLYISRALARSTWLVTDQKYASIINPDYLQSTLYPNMTTKAILKLKKHIRHNIKDETRAEQFYLNEKIKSDALKWLPHCSVTFIENRVEEHTVSPDNKLITPQLFKRLCEKSVSIFEIMLKNCNFYERQQYLQIATFVLKTDIEKYLDILEKNDSNYGFPKLNHKATERIMKHSAKRIIENIEKYVSSIHIPTFVKYFNADEIKHFLNVQAKRALERNQYSNIRKLFNCETLKHFIRRLPKHEQFDFVKNICLKNLPTDAETYQLHKICCSSNRQNYVWFQFAPFDTAFEEITKMIPLCEDRSLKRSMLYLLIKCADYNLEPIQTILKFYISKYKHEETPYKLQFVTEILDKTHISKYDENTWNMLNEVLQSAKVYELNSDLSTYHSTIVKAIIIYNTLNGIKIPEVVEKLFSFNTLKTYRIHMNEEQQIKMFAYLYEHLRNKIKTTIENENDLTESINTLEMMLLLMRDWDKSFVDFPMILSKIKELIKIKKDNSWKVSFTSLYNFNKSWRKYMFEESVALCPTEEVLLNALKHEPQLLARHDDEMNAIKVNDFVTLRRLHAKLRVYWPQSLAQEWTDTYLSNINEAESHIAAVKGLCSLLPQKPLLNIIEKYKPEKPKIDWNETDERVLNVQRLLAQNMHLSRPQPIPDAILSYAKGDYLQYALPSLLAILYNMKSPMNKHYIPKLLDAPVSVQKHGIRHAFKTLDQEELKQIFLNSWNTSKNATIRAIVFKYTFTLLCNEKDPAKAISLWELLETFMDNLTLTEDKETYKLFSKVTEVPLHVRAKFLVKSYNFLEKLIPTVNENDSSSYKWINVNLAEHSRELMDTISPDFILTIIGEFIEQEFFNKEDKCVTAIHHSNGIIRVISAYLLHATNEIDQIRKYEKIMVPLMRRSFEMWGEKREGNFTIRRNFFVLLTRLSYDLKDYVTEKKMIVPIKMYSLIQMEIDKTLSVPENYLLLTKWKLTTALAKLVEQNVSTEMPWDEKCGHEFGKICLEFLKEDVSLHFSCIYVLFSKPVYDIISYILPEDSKVQFYKGLLSDESFIHAFLTTIEISRDRDCIDEKYEDIFKQVFAHPSAEVKMHYFSKIGDGPNI